MLVSTKPGQNKLSEAVETKEKLEKKGKKVFIFIFDELQIDSLINFPDIDSWINTACPRIALEDAFRFRQSIINYDEIDWEKL
jgi:2-(3-amino-3-carboxypropyl)histidine synthase